MSRAVKLGSHTRACSQGGRSCFLLCSYSLIWLVISFGYTYIVQEPAGELSCNGVAGKLDPGGRVSVVDCQGPGVELVCGNIAESHRSDRGSLSE